MNFSLSQMKKIKILWPEKVSASFHEMTVTFSIFKNFLWRAETKFHALITRTGSRPKVVIYATGISCPALTLYKLFVCFDTPRSVDSKPSYLHFFGHIYHDSCFRTRIEPLPQFLNRSAHGFSALSSGAKIAKL